MNCISPVTKKLKDPEVAIRWVDYFYTMEGTLTSRLGREGKEWRKAQPGELSYTGQPATWATITAIGVANNIFWPGLNGPGDWSFQSQQNSSPDIYSALGLETRLYRATVDNYEPYKTKEPIPPLYIPDEDIKKINQNQVDITNYYVENIVRFVTGDLDINKDWDKYIKNFDNLGVKNVLEVYQKTYDKYLKNKIVNTHLNVKNGAG